jgi:septum formation protein
MTGLLLASGSSTRQRLLRDAGVRFDVKPAAIDETSILASLQAEGASGRDAADLLAEMKAQQVSRSIDEWFVIGSDQVLSLGQVHFEKPGTRAAARAQLLKLRGQKHVLSSAVCVARNGSVIWRHVGQARMTMRDFSESFMDEYLDLAGDAILGSVGAYHVEGLGLQLFSAVEGDHFTIQGLPLLPLLDFLRLHGLLKS